MDVRGTVTNIQRFSVHDGPGVRTTVFLKGCPLHCRWCHNPETWHAEPQGQYTAARCIGCGGCAAVCPQGCHTFTEAGHRFDSANCIGCMACVNACLPAALETCGKRYTVDEVLAVVERDRPFYGALGGLTLSGGEPMAQPEFALALLQAAKERGLNTCVETSGVFPERLVEPLCAVADRLLWDVKDTDPDRLLQNTGARLDAVLHNLRLAAAKKPGGIVLRCIIVKGINDTPTHIQAVRQLAEECGAAGVDLLPFHPYGNSKWGSLGMPERPVMGREYIPDEATLQSLRELL